jgi:putative acetyltransferase
VPRFSANPDQRDADVVFAVGPDDPDPHHVEVKSMHTAESARRRGVGRAILEHVLEVVASKDVRRVSLETGAMDAFAPARSLYASAGFVVCDAFGDYEPGPTSTFMTLVLPAAPSSR